MSHSQESPTMDPQTTSFPMAPRECSPFYITLCVPGIPEFPVQMQESKRSLALSGQGRIIYLKVEGWDCQVILLVFSWNKLIYYPSDYFLYSFCLSSISAPPTHPPICQSTFLSTPPLLHPPTHPAGTYMESLESWARSLANL